MYNTQPAKRRTLAGFRAFDTAAQPCNYDGAGVGRTIQRAVWEGIVRREDVCDPRRKPYDITAAPERQAQESMTGPLVNLGPAIDSVVLHQPAADRGTSLRIWRVLETYVPHFASLFLVNEPSPPPSSSCAAAAPEAFTSITLPSVVQNRFYAATGYDGGLRRLGNTYQAYHALAAYRGLVVSGGSPARLLADGARVSAEVAATGWSSASMAATTWKCLTGRQARCTCGRTPPAWAGCAGSRKASRARTCGSTA
ncbi:hypothetical protein DL769_005449 [Monosporascus sp. CRB-8-3]|nr:hypothetical protein DL769_005449 [Monosporascus sp. CRB-8-3]